ncbi:MAG: ROK family protein [Rikenellaceae bacterium]|jgi:predicted NBD/HSP70 family sugar kinase|nr:ROK family protein [Rikenellaceae bacterium]
MNNSFLQQASEGNRSALLKKEIIRQCITGGYYTIPELSREMNISVPTVTKLIGELKDEGFVYDFGKHGANGGRKPSIYGLNPDAGYFVGVDLKNDRMDMGVIDFKGNFTEYQTFRNFLLENSQQSFDELCSIINSFLDGLPVSRQKILAVGINLSGRVNSESGYSYSFYFVEEKPIAMLLEEKLGCNVYIENDSRAMAYGEYMMGAAHNERDMLFVNASWGLGIGIVIDGRLCYGKSGFSGEFGHFPFFENEIICRCGKRGCLETGVSGSAVHRMFLEKLGEGRASMLSGRYKKGEPITLDDIMLAVTKEDVLAIEITEEVGNLMGRAISGLVNLFNPELIVIGGTLATARDYLMLPIKSAINKHSLLLVSKDTTIKFSKLGEKAGVAGACMLSRGKLLRLL